MEAVRWERRPKLRQPVVVVAFEGWNDAADAASGAVAYLARTIGARKFAEIDPEEFYDFTVVRPEMRLDPEGVRSIRWPGVELSAAALEGGAGDVVFISGHEPQLRWRRFCSMIVEVVKELDASMVLTLGALLADVPHTKPIRVTGTAGDTLTRERLGLLSSSYEGPTGILGVLQENFGAAGVPSASLWANVPHYVSQSPSPKATLALVERTRQILGTKVDSLELEIASAAYDRQVDELVAADDDAAAYVARLEQEGDDVDIDAALGTLEPPSAEELAAEVERFLRERHKDR